MAGYLHRNGGEGGLMRSTGNGKAILYNPNSPLPTPLQDFVKAKEKINGIFKQVQQYVEEAADFLNALASSRQLISDASLTESQMFRDSVRTIREVLARDHMKVVFFGRTSNGKSTVVNAMLHSKVLPSGMGHTTRCFVQVEASTSGEKYILTEGSSDEQGLESIDNLAHALCSEEMGEDTLVRICWPKSDSKLLQNEVVLVDSPGIDVSPQFDAWIDKHCLDADVFVLVSNAESTLTQTEKNFFHRVSAKVSKPNVFILNNRWDASAAEPEFIDQVRAQHTNRFLHFLVDELQVSSQEEAKHRIFFVSAKEMLSCRLKDKGISSPSRGASLAEGYQARMLEFEDFERQFELCISHSAINTKFEAHIERGKSIIQNLHKILEEVNVALAAERQKNLALHTEKRSELQASQTHFIQFLTEARQKIQLLSAEVQLKVSSDLSEETKRIDSIIESFQKPFSDESVYLNTYKEELTYFVDDVLNNSMTVRSTGGLLDRILGTEKELITTVSGLLPSCYTGRVGGIVQFRDPFRFSFSFNCPSLMEDFQEDLEFRFSLGLSSLIRRFTQIRTGSSMGNNLVRREEKLFGSSFIPRPISTPDVDLPPSTSSDYSYNEDIVMKSIIYTSATYVANGGVGLLIIGGVVYRAVGWKIIAGCAAIYALLYVYERLSWNNRTKEQSFKQQFRKHLMRKLRHLSNTVAMNCDSQVTREVQEVLTRIQKISTEAFSEMKTDVDRLQKELEELDQLGRTLIHTKGKATFLSAELGDFKEKYLKKSPK